MAIKGISKKDREQYYDALEKADDAFEGLHCQIEQGKSFTVNEIDQLIEVKNFDEITAIVFDRLKDSVGRLKEVDNHHIDKEAQLPLSDLARIYNYSSDYLRNLINRGKLKGKKRGKIWHYK